MTEHPTREQLLALQPGQELRFGGIRVHRPHLDSRNPDNDVLHFSKRYPVGMISFSADRMMVEDMAADPWELVVDQIERPAAEKRAHWVRVIREAGDGR